MFPGWDSSSHIPQQIQGGICCLDVGRVKQVFLDERPGGMRCGAGELNLQQP